MIDEALQVCRKKGEARVGISFFLKKKELVFAIAAAATSTTII